MRGLAFVAAIYSATSVDVPLRDYLVLTTDEGYDYHSADLACRRTYGTRLASVESVQDAEQLLLRRSESDNPDGVFWIGLTDRDWAYELDDYNEGQWRFLGHGRSICPDGDCKRSPFWKDGQPSLKAAGSTEVNNEDCALLEYESDATDLKLFDDVKCSLNKTVADSEPIGAICNSPYIAIKADNRLNRKQANALCLEKLGSELASIEWYRDAVAALASTDQSEIPGGNFWVGLKDTSCSSKEGIWKNEEEGDDCNGDCALLGFWADNEPDQSKTSDDDCARIINKAARTGVYDMLTDIGCSNQLPGVLCNAAENKRECLKALLNMEEITPSKGYVASEGIEIAAEMHIEMDITVNSLPKRLSNIISIGKDDKYGNYLLGIYLNSNGFDVEFRDEDGANPLEYTETEVVAGGKYRLDIEMSDTSFVVSLDHVVVIREMNINGHKKADSMEVFVSNSNQPTADVLVQNLRISKERRCPPGQRFTAISDGEARNHFEAQKECIKTVGTELATIDRDWMARRALWTRDRLSTDPDGAYWTGLRTVGSGANEEWHYLDGNHCGRGKCMNLRTWADGQPEEENQGECVYIIPEIELISEMLTTVECTDDSVDDLALQPLCNAPERSYIPLISDTGYTFEEAQAECSERYGTTLATIQNRWDAHTLINERARSLDQEGFFWVGLKDEGEGFTDITRPFGKCPNGDCETMEFWAGSGYWPNNADGTESCARIHSGRRGVTNLITNADCSTQYNAMCNAPPKREYVAIITEAGLTYNQANAACRKQVGTELATIIDRRDAREALKTRGTSAGRGQPFWIGLSDQTKEGTFTFEDNGKCRSNNCNALNFWAPGQPSNTGGNEDCALIRDGSVILDNMLDDAKCSLKQYEGLTVNALCNAPDENRRRARDGPKRKTKPVSQKSYAQQAEAEQLEDLDWTQDDIDLPEDEFFGDFGDEMNHYKYPEPVAYEPQSPSEYVLTVTKTDLLVIALLIANVAIMAITCYICVQRRKNAQYVVEDGGFDTECDELVQ